MKKLLIIMIVFFTAGKIQAQSAPASSPIDEIIRVSSPWIVNSNSSIYYNQGNVGIGISSPSQKLDVSGHVVIRSNLYMDDGDLRNVHGLYLKDWDDDTGGDDNTYRLLGRDGAWQFYNGGVVIGGYGNGTWGDLADGNLIVSGNVGIGVTHPQAKVSVSGKIRSVYDPTEAEFIEIGHGGSNAYINTVGDGKIDFRHDGNTLMSLQDNGKLAVSGVIQSTSGGIQFPDGSVQTSAAGTSTSGIYVIQNGGIYSSLPNHYGIIEVKSGSGPHAWVGGIQAGSPGQIVKIKVRDDGTSSAAALIWNEYSNAPDNNKILLNNGLSTISLEKGQSISLFYNPQYNRWQVFDVYDDNIYTIGQTVNQKGNIPMLNGGVFRESNLYHNPNYNQILVGYNQPSNVSHPNYTLDVNGAINAAELYINGQPLGNGTGNGGGWTVTGNDSYKVAGKVGIGLSAPGERLHIKGNASDKVRLRISDNGGYNYNIGVDNLTGHNEFHIRRGGDSYFAITNDGGNDTRLILGHGNGKVIVNNELCVSSPLAPCPDYVFEEDYELMSLSDLETYIQQHKHLPNVKSASEIADQGGVNFIEMSYSLLEKVEELTLYTLQQDRMLSDYKKDQEALRAELMLLKAQLAHLNDQK